MRELLYQDNGPKEAQRNSNENNTRCKSNSTSNGIKGPVNCMSPSEITFYKDAVPLLGHNISTLSDEFINTSDDSGKLSPLNQSTNATNINESVPIISGERGRSRERNRYASRGRQATRSPAEYHRRARSQSRDSMMERQVAPPEVAPKQHADNVIRDAERAKERMLTVPGKIEDRILLHSVMIDESYLLVAAHIDENMRRKILQFDYVDFSRLLLGDRVVQEEDQHLTFVNKGGTPFLVPVSESPTAIHSYGKWDQAFRVYSDVITSTFPEKAQELIQYNHIIHTASQTYLWDNVYLYDKDFRIHISRNPTRSWAVILQQAWSMRLKDKINGNQSKGSTQNSSTPGNKSKDYCRRFQPGQCNLGLSCRYEHRCTICGKFGHGAHICRCRTDNWEDRNDKHDRFNFSSDRHDSWNRGRGNHQGGGQHQ